MPLNLDVLDAEQREAVTAPDGPLLIEAGPGSGKTTVLAGRLAYLLEQRGVEPESVVALTYTNKARDELRDRLYKLVGADAGLVGVFTFDSFGYRVVRHYHYLLPYTDEPIPYDEEAAEELLAEALRAVGRDPEREKLGELTRETERARLAAEGSWASGWRTSPKTRELVEAYERFLFERNAVDFAGMVAFPLRIFGLDPEALELYQTGYRYVLVDEYQDTSQVQYEILRRLGQLHRNLTAVGDRLQSIYRWRGADPEKVIERFRADYPEYKEVRLLHNYRSGGRILAAANALSLKLDPERQLNGLKPPGEEVWVQGVEDEAAEAAYVADTIVELCGEGRIGHPGRVQVLYRTRAQAEALMGALRQKGLPFVVRGSGELLRKREVRDVVAYLRLAYDPEDSEALARVVNRPPRKLAAVEEALRTEPVGLGELPRVLGGLCGDEERLPEAAFAAGIEFMELIEGLERAARESSIAELLDAVLESTGYGAWAAGGPGGDARTANLRTVRALAEKADGCEGGFDREPRDRLGAWLAELSAGGDHATLPEEAERVVLSTIHGSKGSESDVVFLVGCEDGLLPIDTALELTPEKPRRMKEELCLCYVALTRARNRLYITHARERERGGKVRPAKPSRFIAYALPDRRAA